MKRALFQSKLAIGADYTISHARGEQIIVDGTAAPAFPNVVSRLASLKLYATCHLKDNLSLNGTYWYEHYYSEDWHLDGVSPATIPNVLTLGEQPPAYYVNVVMPSLRFRC